MRLAVAQCGGPTAVLNASLYGVWEQARRSGLELWGVPGGPSGLLAGRLLPLSGPPPDWLRRAPGAALGAGRAPLTPQQASTLAQQLCRLGIDALVLIGGNGTMALAAALASHLPVVGVPKTVDNDLQGTDHAPGYASAAHLVAQAVADLARDLVAMAGFEDVRVVEVMGRRAGWLAAASVLARRWPGDLPQLVLLPEVPVDLDALAARVGTCHREQGSVLLVVAEGIADPSGQPLGRSALDAAGQRAVYGGASQRIGDALRQRLGLAVRVDNLGLLPRCYSGAATARDRAEAQALGRHAVRVLQQGAQGVMVALPATAEVPFAGHTPEGEATAITDPEQVPVTTTALERVAGLERYLPADYLPLGDAFVRWLRNLVPAPCTAPALLPQAGAAPTWR